ncbi:protein [Lasallia pustulata]|uniref:Protein n=1 Tax=Lasallia pustulata TaxID=136370 RepID=A0A1W5D8A2_9LECA|nr:protein [Lasallia pustulata]
MKELARQLLQGLDFLHRECGIIHTDLKPSNILFELDNSEAVVSRYIENTSVRTSLSKRTQLQDINAGSEKSASPTPLSEAIITPLLSESDDFHVRTIDFGVSSWVHQHLTEQIQSPHLRAPEVTLGAPWSTGVDIWSLGCLIIEFVKGHLSFPGPHPEMESGQQRTTGSHNS